MTNTVGDAQIKLGLDASGVVTGIGEAKKSIDSLGASTQKAVGPITPEMEKASAATQRFAREVVKTEIALLSGGKQTAAYKQAISELNGLGGNALKPYLESLRATEQAQRAATAAMLGGNVALTNMGMTAKATTAALRQVPAQFTDIITSLQGGQAPLTVLLQQGGQLKDVFGGVGNAARALGGYVLGLVNPFTVTAAAVTAIGFAFDRGAQEQRDFQKTLILTGNAAGVTANLLSQAAANIDAASGATQGKAAEALNIFVNAGVRGRESLERFTASAIEFERAGGGSIEKVAENFAKLGKDPLKASLALNESMNYLTRSLYEQIKALEDQGKSTEAAKLAQEAYKSAIDTATPQLLENLGSIERGWKAITDATKKAYDAALNVGRAATPAQQIAELQQRIASRGQTISSGGFASNEGGAAFGRGNAGLSKLREEQAADELSLRSLSKKLLLETELTAAKTTQAESLKVALQADELRAKYLDKQVEKTKELAKINNSFKAGGLTEKERDSAVSEVNKKYEDKSTSGVGDLNRGISAQIEALKQGAAIKAEIAKQEADTRSSEFKRGLLNELQFIEQEKAANLESLAARKSIIEKELSLAKGKKDSQVEQARLAGEIALNEQQAATVIIKAKNDVAESFYKQAKAAEDASARQLSAAFAGADTIKAQAIAQEQANTTFGLGAAALQELKLAQLESSKAALEATDSVIPGYISALELQIDAQKRLIDAAVTGDSLKAGQASIDEFNKLIDQIDKSKLDGLFGGALKGVDQLISSLEKYAQVQEKGKKAADAASKQREKGLISEIDYQKIIKDIESDKAEASQALMQQSLGAFKSMTTEGSSAYKALTVAQAALGAATALSAIANQGLGDPYTAIPRMLAMAATMAQLGFAINGLSGGGGAAPTNQGTGTVFGDPTAKSASIENSLKLLETSRLGLKYTEQMARSLKNIEAAFAGVTNLVLRNGQISNLEGSIQTGATNSSTGRLIASNDIGNQLTGGALSGFFNGLATKLFGNRISIQGSGILGGPQSFGDIQDLGFQGNYYADIETKKKFLGITRSTTNSTVLSELDDELSRQFTQIFTGIGDSVTAAGNALGIRTQVIQDALSTYIVDIGKIDLRGLNGEEIQEKLAAVFGAEFDKLALAIIPGLESIQQVGEGYGETLVRAATQLESVNTTFGLLGGSLSLFTKSADIFLEKLNGGFRANPGIDRAIVADQLVQQFGGLEEFNSATQAFYESFYSEGERTRATLGLLSTSLEGIGLTLPDSIQSWRDLTTSLDVTTEAGQQAFEALITLGPAFADLQNQLLESAGISGGAIADVLRDGMLRRITQEDIGSKLSGILIVGIYNSLANGFAEQISSTFTSQIIAPMLQSVATGGVLSASISQASIDTVVATATNAANQLAAILGDAGFQSAIAGVQAAIDGIAGALPGKAATTATQSYANLGGAVSAASSAASKGADAWKSIGDSLTAEIDRIRGVLTGGDKASALASFATLTAQTRAGDLEAGKLLPSASQAYIKAVEETAGSLLDVKRAQGFALSSLMETRSIIGQGPAVSAPTSFTPSFTPSYSTGGAVQNNDAVVSELKLLRAQVARLEATSQTTADVLDKSAKAGNGGGALAVEVQT